TRRWSRKTWSQSSGGLRKGITSFGFHHRFDVEEVSRHDAHLRCGRRRWIERFVGGAEIVQGISHRLENERCAVMLRPIEILASKLTDSCGESFVQPSSFQPPGVKTERIR